MEKKEAIVLTLSILKQVMEEKIKEDLVELYVVENDQSYQTLKKEEIKTLLGDLKDLN